MNGALLERFARGELVVERCGACGHAQLYPRGACARCMSETMSLEPASGRGTGRSRRIRSVTTNSGAEAEGPPGEPPCAAQRILPPQRSQVDTSEANTWRRSHAQGFLDGSRCSLSQRAPALPVHVPAPANSSS
jgi:hypothetical protein